MVFHFSMVRTRRKMRRRVFPICFLLALLGISFGCTNSGDGASRSSSEPRDRQSVAPAAPESTHIEIDIPKLAFVRKVVVEKLLGRQLREHRDTNIMTWSEGSIVDTTYKRAQCIYLEGRLVSITYEFKKRPATVADALELSGLPRESASLDNAHQDHLPYRAFYAPNPDYRNPIRCCGLLLQSVSIGEDRSDIWINFANINDHFRDWPEEIRSAWFRAGGNSLSSSN